MADNERISVLETRFRLLCETLSKEASRQADILYAEAERLRKSKRNRPKVRRTLRKK